MGQHEIYVGNIPPEMNLETLELIFSLCGQEFTVRLVEFNTGKIDHRFYAFLSFKNENDMKKVLLFRSAVIGRKKLIIERAEHKNYGIMLNKKFRIFDKSIEEEFVKLFPYKIRSWKHGINKCFINFIDEETRQKALNLPSLLGQPFDADIYEPADVEISPVEPEGEFPIFVRNIPCTTTNYELEKIFSLCGSILSTSVVMSENSFTIGTVVFASLKSSYLAKKFHERSIRNWPLPIKIFLNKHDEHPLSGHIYRLKLNKYGPLKLKDFEKKYGDVVGEVIAERTSDAIILNFKTLTQMTAVYNTRHNKGSPTMEKLAIRTFQQELPSVNIRLTNSFSVLSISDDE